MLLFFLIISFKMVPRHPPGKRGERCCHFSCQRGAPPSAAHLLRGGNDTEATVTSSGPGSLRDGPDPLPLPLRRAAPPLPDPGRPNALICIFLPLFPGPGQSECGTRRGGGAGRALGGAAAAAGCRAGGSRCGRGTAAPILNPEPRTQNPAPAAGPGG